MSKKSPKSSKLLTSASLAGTLLLSAGSQQIKALPEKPPELRLPFGLISPKELKSLLAKALDKILPSSSRVLTTDEENKLSQAIRQILGIKAVAELDGNRLNHQIGLIGLEQHLKRYPGDTLKGRDFPEVGLAPQKPAWGYFAPSQARLASSQVDMEKYYVAVQTLYLKDWQARLKELRDWYRYRKVLVINPKTGAAVVAVIADAGPAKWTGKQFGGSPQVMHHLGLYPKKTSGQVVLLFVDDPANKIPLGPVNYPVQLKPPPKT
jgi:hypothetical protein